MAYFEDGVKEYITGYAVIAIHFPVDYKGNSDISCNRCKMFSRNTGFCKLTNEVSEYPNTNVGSNCPLMPLEVFNEYLEREGMI